MHLETDNMNSQDEAKWLSSEGNQAPRISDWTSELDEDLVQKLAFSCPVDHSGSSVYVQGWARSDSENPPVIIVHDLGEHIELYSLAAQKLVRQGFNVYGFDLRGHGKSLPLTGDVLKLSDLVNDLLQVVAWIRHKSQRQLPFLLGQGVGALILMHFQKTYPRYAQRSILLAPIVQEQAVLPVLGQIVLSSMAKLFPGTRLPRFLLPYFLPVSDESRERGLDSALVITARFAQELLEAIREVEKVFRSLCSLNLIVCPVDDAIYSINRLQKLIEQHPEAAQLDVCEVKGISSRALTGDLDEIDRLFKVLLPWMFLHCRLSPNF